MVAVPNAPEAVAWYMRALGAVELWNLGSVAGLEIAGAPSFVGETANNGRESPTKHGKSDARNEGVRDARDAITAHPACRAPKGSVGTLRNPALACGRH